MKPDDIRAYLEAKHSAVGPTTRAPADAEAGTLWQAPAAAARDEQLYESISKSYFILRRGLALLALAFPIILLLGVGLDNVQGSLSAYYHFSVRNPDTYGAGTMRDIFVGVLCAIGAFLYFYKGYSWEEDAALDVAGVAALGVALFPKAWGVSGSAPAIVATLHLASAITFFFAIAYVCVFRSKDTLKILKNPPRRQFRLGYRILGTLMIVLPLSVVLVHLLSGRVEPGSAVLWVEVAGVYVFAVFWLVKSREIALIEKQQGIART
jgi:hypothetical protein